MGLDSECQGLSLALSSQLGCPWASDLASQSLGFLNCKMGTIIVLTAWAHGKGFLADSEDEALFVTDFIGEQGGRR